MSDIGVPVEHRIKTIERSDGMERVLIISPRRGVFQFAVETNWEDEGMAWTQVSDLSGLYGSAEEAERDARVKVDWLRYLT